MRPKYNRISGLSALLLERAVQASTCGRDCLRRSPSDYLTFVMEGGGGGIHP